MAEFVRSRVHVLAVDIGRIAENQVVPIPAKFGKKIRAQEADPVPYPVDFRWIPPTLITWFYGLREGLALTDAAVHEWVGLVFYRVTGKTDTLFPGPTQ